MNINELIDRLQKLKDKYGEAEVITEGCDCLGDIEDVIVYEMGTYDPEITCFLQREKIKRKCFYDTKLTYLAG